MMGPQHRIFGGLCGAGVATYQGGTFTIIAMTAIVATASAHGWSSPDVDQTTPWRNFARALPGPLGRAMKHRGITHWPGWVVLAWFGIQSMPGETQWALTALLIGWASHIVGDVVFGKIPVTPWGSGLIGMGLDTGGLLETKVVRFAMVLALAYLIYLPLAVTHALPRMT
jgi:hypothetical protein